MLQQLLSFQETNTFHHQAIATQLVDQETSFKHPIQVHPINIFHQLIPNNILDNRTNTLNNNPNNTMVDNNNNNMVDNKNNKFQFWAITMFQTVVMEVTASSELFFVDSKNFKI